MGQQALVAARYYVSKGLSVIPVVDDGSKGPAVRWAIWQKRHPTPQELEKWFSGSCDGMALICGRVSGNVEVLDFDDPDYLKPWGDTVIGELGEEWVHRLPITRTPSGGTHVFWRCEMITGNQKLAQKPVPKDPALGGTKTGIKTCIETRGEGGYVLIPPTPARYHPANKPYKLMRGDLGAIPQISIDERDILLGVARALTRLPAAPALSKFESQNDGRSLFEGDRPGDLYNERASWFEILEPHGWKAKREDEGTVYWQRPGKEGPGISATTAMHHGDCLFVFSTNADPFEAGKSYTKFAAFALLEFGGDFRKAAEALADEQRSRG